MSIRKKHFFELISVIILCLICLVAVPNLGIAQTQPQTQQSSELNLTTSPLPVSLKTEPGRNISTDLRIQNSGTNAEKLKVELLKFDSDNTSGTPRLLEQEEGDEYFDWVSFSEDEFEILPGEWKTIKMTIDVPSDAGLGYYFAPVFSRVENGSQQGNDTTSLRGGVAILVLLEVFSDDAIRQLKISSFSSNKGLYEYLPANFSLEIENTGNIHASPSGNIFLYKDGKQIDLISFNSGSGNILPSSKREFNSDWSNGFPRFERTGTNDDMQLVWNWDNASNLRFGKYTATAFLVYDDGKRDIPIEATVSFWVLPWKLMAVGVLLVLLMVIGLIGIVKRLASRSRQHD